MCMHMADSLCCATETNTVLQLYSNYTPIKQLYSNKDYTPLKQLYSKKDLLK